MSPWLAAVQAKTYDLVLMDIQMSGMDSISATQRIRALQGTAARVPIVAMTANVLTEQVVEFRAAGMNDHVGKPFRQNALLSAIDRWTSRAFSVWAESAWWGSRGAGRLIH
jgi:CheY-like chemotaxis protein